MFTHLHEDSSCSNPASTAEEYAAQCEMTKPTLIVASQEQLNAAVEAGAMNGVPARRIIPIDRFYGIPSGVSRTSVTDLIAEGMKMEQAYVERRLAPGEAKTKTALYCFSSGTTGRPKVFSVSIVPCSGYSLGNEGCGSFSLCTSCKCTTHYSRD